MGVAGRQVSCGRTHRGSSPDTNYRFSALRSELVTDEEAAANGRCQIRQYCKNGLTGFSSCRFSFSLNGAKERKCARLAAAEE